jgi:hypothetical protein
MALYNSGIIRWLVCIVLSVGERYTAEPSHNTFGAVIMPEKQTGLSGPLDQG